MIVFGGLPFKGFIAIFALIGVVYALRAFWAYRIIAREAQLDYDYKAKEAMVNKSLSRAEYVKIYRRVHNPRRQSYIALTILAVFIITPISTAIFEYIYGLIYNLSGQSRVIEPGFLVWQFFVFFFFIINIVAIAYFMARHYYNHRPSSLQTEIDKALSAKHEF